MEAISYSIGDVDPSPLPLLSATVQPLCILAHVNNSAKLPLFLPGAVKDPHELAQGHVPGPAPHAVLENPAVLAPVTRAVLRALGCRRGTALRPSRPPSCRKCELSATRWGTAGTTAGRCCGKRDRADRGAGGTSCGLGEARVACRLGLACISP